MHVSDHAASSSSSAFACFRSGVSNPSEIARRQERYRTQCVGNPLKSATLGICAMAGWINNSANSGGSTSSSPPGFEKPSVFVSLGGRK